MGYRMKLAPSKFKPFYKYQITDEKGRRVGLAGTKREAEADIRKLNKVFRRAK